jgi:hypothetical protein
VRDLWYRLGREYALTIEDIRKTAGERGGECLSIVYQLPGKVGLALRERAFVAGECE